MTKNNTLIIGNTEVAPGERASIDLPVADLYTGTSLHMPGPKRAAESYLLEGLLLAGAARDEAAGEA